jgi:hypothetical protein
LPAGSSGITVLPVKTITFKVSDDDALSIRTQARKENLSVSEFLRRRAVSVGNQEKITTIRCEFTGAEIFAPSGISKTPLTVEATREMLADFP